MPERSQHVAGLVALDVGHIDSPLGRLTLVAAEGGLLEILWPGVEPPPARRRPQKALEAARRQLEEYFEGARRAFSVPLELAGTPFQLAAWRELARIPFGETRTYSEQAARLGAPAAVRAVGAANARNPLPIILPCHRLVGRSGELRGFAGGLEAKRWLLEHERRVRLG